MQVLAENAGKPSYDLDGIKAFWSEHLVCLAKAVRELTETINAIESRRVFEAIPLERV